MSLKKRYFLKLAYNGFQYGGWQKQQNTTTIQGILDEKLSLLLRQLIETVGCGRTDAGVHAAQFYAHFDFEGLFPEHFLDRLNKMLGPSIVIYDCMEVPDDLHARFSAYQRSYIYFIDCVKNPFHEQLAWQFFVNNECNKELMQATALLLQNYTDFFPFCKTGGAEKTKKCRITACFWEFEDHQWRFHISSDRFLRGMVRLLVGACIQVGQGQIQLEDVKEALDKQIFLKKSWSVPPQGLYLSKVNYHYFEQNNQL